MHHYSQGKPTTQAHKGIPEGCFEEEQGLLGFYGPVSHLIRPQPSTRWVKIEGSLRPHLFDLVKIELKNQRQRLLYNSSLTISWQWEEVKTGPEIQAERNADGDTIYFCHQGSGEIFTEYGLLNYRRGHYIVVPKCLTHAIAPKERSCFYVIEDRTSHYREPDRGMAGRNAFYDEQAIVKPNLDVQPERLRALGAEVKEVVIQRAGEFTKFIYDQQIFDVIGWKGDLYPFTLHVDDMMPLMSHRAHLPPSAHTTLVARDFVVCTFLPRPLERDKDALKVPFYHQNIDYDEVLFYHDGDFFSRDNLHAGMITFHPAGFPHGPHPKAVKASQTKTETDEYAVMVDSRLPLLQDEALKNVEVTDYWQSWQKK